MQGLNRSLPSKPVRLILFTHPGGNHSIVTCREDVAAHFGWLERYETYAQMVIREAKATNGLVDIHRIRAVNRNVGGQQLRVCRTVSKDGNPAGKTNAIRINSRVNNIDLAELVAFSKNDLQWMEARNGARVDRDTWLRIYTGDAKVPNPIRARAA